MIEITSKIFFIFVCIIPLSTIVSEGTLANMPQDFHSIANANDGSVNHLRDAYLGENQLGKAPIPHKETKGESGIGSITEMQVIYPQNQQNGINIININGENNCIDQNLKPNALIPQGTRENSKTKKHSQDGINLVNINNIGQTRQKSNNCDLIAINFININYGDLSEGRHLGRSIDANEHCSQISLQDNLKQMAKRAEAHEREWKENLELLKRIAS